MSFQFTHPEVAEKYVSIFSVDKFITIQKVYWGKLSDITPEAAAKLIELEDNQIRLKTPAGGVAVTDTKPKKEI